MGQGGGATILVLILVQMLLPAAVLLFFGPMMVDDSIFWLTKWLIIAGVIGGFTVPAFAYDHLRNKHAEKVVTQPQNFEKSVNEYEELVKRKSSRGAQ